jgi:hypothetical protein
MENEFVAVVACAQPASNTISNDGADNAAYKGFMTGLPRNALGVTRILVVRERPERNGSLRNNQATPQ